MGYLIIVYLVYMVIFGCITKYVAGSKGYDGGFFWGFFLGIIGLLVVGFRPNITTSSAEVEYKPMYGGALQASNQKKPSWTCTCGSTNPDRLDYCPICRKSRKDGEKPGDVRCPHCGAMNNASRDICVLCEKPLRADVVLPVQSTAPAQAQKPEEGQTQAEAQKNAGSTAQPEGLELLEKLAKLHQEGILTDEEFSRKKAQILEKL